MSQRASSSSSSSTPASHHYNMATASTSSTVPLKMPAPVAASGSVSRRAGKESTRSSRRRLGSTGPPVILGGGVGAIGKAAELGVQNLDQYSTLYNKPAAAQQSRSVSPGPIKALHYPVAKPAAYPSPRSPLFASPSSTQQSSHSFTEKSGSSHSSRSRSPAPNSHSTVTSTSATASASTNSLSTTASTSSRTLKTPHSSKVENPIIASSSGINLDSSPSIPLAVQRAKSFQYQSPTPNRTQVPAMAQGPLPPTPLTNDMKYRGSTKPLNIPPNRGKTPPPLDVNNNHLSQNWVHVDDRDVDNKVTSSAIDEKPTIPARNNARLPTAKMVPVKKLSSDIAPDNNGRPSLERNMTAPPLSPTPQSSKAGRKSFDQLRSTSPSPASRQTSLSTPPTSILEAASSSSSSYVWKTEIPKAEKPPLFSRRSEDLLRTSTETAPTKKEIRAMQQRTLGVAGTAALSPPADMERKPSGMSLKKSSGALKALFQRGASGKGKEKERTEVPPIRRRPSGDELRRPSGDELRQPSLGSRPTPSPVQKRDSPDSYGRASFSADRTMYPAALPMLRAASTGTTPIAGPSKPRKPTRRSPAPPQTVSPVSAPSEQSPETPSSEMIPSSSLPYLSAMANRVSLAPAADITPASQIEGLSSSTTLSDSMFATPKAFDSIPLDISPIKHSKSLHLLSLPDLDLNFDFGFDNFSQQINAGGSPTTPRRTPRKSPRSPRSPYRSVKPSPKGSPAPARSFSTRSPRAAPTPPKLQRTASERRRSQSFDGPAGSIPMIDDFWKSTSDMGINSNTNYISPSVAKIFAAASSSSAPTLNNLAFASLLPEKPLPIEFAPAPIPIQEAEFSAEGPRSRSRSNSSRVSSSEHASSDHASSDHVRTPSNASSTNETPSPSPPQTPPERNLDGLGFGDISPEGTVIAETPSEVSIEVKAEPVVIKKPVMLNIVPDIPLPAVPSPALASPAIIETPKTEEKHILRKPRQKVMSLMSKSQIVNPDPNTTIRGLAKEVEKLLYKFRHPSQGVTSADRATMLRNDLLSLMLEVDKRAYDRSEEQSYAMLRAACFEWAEALLFELRAEQPANERGACLEGLAAVVESACLSEQALKNSPSHQAKFTQMMIKCMTFVMSKLGAKGVFHNTLLFSGRFLAFAFFRIPHVGEQLVTVLQPPKGALMRFTKNIMMGVPQCPVKPDYPEHLLPLCFDNSRAYTARLASLSAEFPTEEERDAFLFQPGNWLRRWQSDDSELFPAFYRAYHRQLAVYLGPIVEYYEALDRPVPASELMRAPGYAHLATIFAKKCHSYILGSVNAVTTSSSSSNFEATETAGFRGSQKPPVLETANRRLVETISTFANLRVMIPTSRGTSKIIECDGTQLWSNMIDIWVKNLISKTSLYAPKGVFSLFDLLDGVVDPPFETTSSGIEFGNGGNGNGNQLEIQGQQPIYSLLDVPHLIYVIRMILTEGEHALTLVKAIAFVFTHWEVLTARSEDRKELCLDLLLQKELFERLLLFWSQSVRSYILRLVVFRLGHLHTRKEDGSGHLVEIESVKLLQTRLDKIKKRHDELEPKAYDVDDLSKEEQIVPLTPVSENGFGGMSRSKSTITMVAESPKYVSPVNKAEKLLGLGLGIENSSSQSSGQSQNTSNSNSNNSVFNQKNENDDLGSSGKIGKATNWFKKSFGNKKKKKESSPSISPSPSPSASPKIGEGTSSSDTSSPPSSLTGSPNMPTTSLFKSSPRIPEIQTKSPSLPSSPEITPGEVTGMTRKAKPPTIITTSPSISSNGVVASESGSGPKSPNTFSFEFELPTTSPRSDTFDPTPQSQSQGSLPNSPSRNSLLEARRTSQPPSPGQPPSPHMSRSFSKRSSLLPPKTASALEGLINENDKEKLRSIDSHSNTNESSESHQSRRTIEEDKGYDKKLHAYAIRMLAELEDAQKEYDEWWSDGGVGKMDGAPPRLTVAWPFHDGED